MVSAFTDPRISVALDVIAGLIQSALQISGVLRDKGTLSEDDLKAIITEQNAAQDKARAALNELLKG